MKVCSKSILIQKSDFQPPKSLLRSRTATRFEKSWIKNGISKNIDIPCRFPLGIYGNFMKLLFKSLGRGCQTEWVLGAKCENGLPKVSRNLVHVMKKWTCAKKCDFLKTINGASDLLWLLTLISRNCEIPWNFMKMEWEFTLLQGACIKS